MAGKKVKVRVYQLSWGGDMEKVFINVPEYPKGILKYDGWFSPNIGELCFNRYNGKMSYVKDLSFQRPSHMWKGGTLFILADHKHAVSKDSIVRIGVKKGKEFFFKGRKFKFKEPTDGGIIKEIALEKLRIKESTL